MNINQIMEPLGKISLCFCAGGLIDFLAQSGNLFSIIGAGAGLVLIFTMK